MMMIIERMIVATGHVMVVVSWAWNIITKNKPAGQFWIERVILGGKLGGKEILAAVGVEEEGGGKGDVGETRAEGTT